ncbi:MAG TPA: hypothetical protein VFU31_15865 [Candidatus Binatia bacterium]|nr:hypothetical protein [Candidatus Binatia bacterium]
MTKEKAAMEVVAGNENVMMAKMMMRYNDAFIVEMLVMPEVMRVAATEVETHAMTAKRSMETAGSPEAMGGFRVAKVPSSAGRGNLYEKKHREDGSD